MAARRRRREALYRVNQAWRAAEVRALRAHLGVTQEELSRQLGMRQQTVSEWEVGKHRPRGASLTLLGVIAERAGFAYVISATEAAGPDGPDGGAHAS